MPVSADFPSHRPLLHGSIVDPTSAVTHDVDVHRPVAKKHRQRSPLRSHLHVGHFAFMRAYVQGLPVEAIWDHYLSVEGENDDRRAINRTIRWLREACAAAARREHKPGTARLLVLELRSGGASTAAPVEVPTLDQFVDEYGLEDYSEAEQLEHYHERYGSGTTREQGQARLIKKQLDALAWLQLRVAQKPSAGDAIAAWFIPGLANRLHGVKLQTLGQLVEHINGSGLYWWRQVAAIGQHKAARIVHWLHEFQESIGVAIGSHALSPRSRVERWQLQRVVRAGTGLLPLDKFIVPAQLDGTRGLYRAPQHLCLMGAHNDLEAVLTWLRSKQGLTPEHIAAVKRQRGIAVDEPEGALTWLQYLSNTQRAYLREGERFLLWAVLRQRRPLSSMRVEDCLAYRDFIADPPADWCGPRGRGRWSPLWRPFEGPLSPRAQTLTLTVLQNLYRYLVDTNYLIGNPWQGIAFSKKKTGKKATRPDAGRSFTQAQWQFMQNKLAALSDTSANRRLSFTLHLMHATGLRISEALGVKADDLRWVSYPDPDGGETAEGWELTVMGKGSKLRTVAVSYEVVNELARYLESRGLDIDPESAANQGVFLIGKAVDVEKTAPWSPQRIREVNPRGGISASTLQAQFKVFFNVCADELAQVDHRASQRFQDASAHWMRHTHGTHAAAAGVPLDVLKDSMGHESLETTSIYLTSEQRRRLVAMKKLWNEAG